MEAAAALAHLAARGQQGIGEGLDLLAGLPQQVQGQALGRARPDAGQALELIDQPRQGSGEAAQRPGAGAMNLGRAFPRRERMPGTCPAVMARPSRLRAWPRLLLSFALIAALGLGLGACSAAAAGLNSFSSPDGRYAFLYPTGWTRVQVSDGPQVVFHDLINSDETLSLVISEVTPDRDVASLGSAVAVGETLRRVVIAPEGSGRAAELVEAREREQDGHTFFDLEYAVHLADRDRHELATVVADRGRLYTFAASTNEVRWPKVKELFERVITSFTLQI